MEPIDDAVSVGMGLARYKGRGSRTAWGLLHFFRNVCLEYITSEYSACLRTTKTDMNPDLVSIRGSIQEGKGFVADIDSGDLHG